MGRLFDSALPLQSSQLQAAMTALTFVIFVATVIVVVAGVLIAKWLFEYLSVPERPRNILLVVIAVVGGVIIFAFAYRIITSFTLYT